jgi:hypothetical protein
VFITLWAYPKQMMYDVLGNEKTQVVADEQVGIYNYHLVIYFIRSGTAFRNYLGIK